MTQTPILLGTLLVLGLLVGLSVSRIGLPRVSGYVLVGMLMAPKLLGNRLGFHAGEWVAPLADSALGVVAYLVGGALSVAQLKRVGKTILSSALGEATGAAIAVSLVIAAYLWLLPLRAEAPSTLALALGAVAMTTAPAGTVAVVHQYRARGPVTSTLLGVVAVDDAIGIVAFSLVVSSVTGGTGDGVIAGVQHIVTAVLLGTAAAFALTWIGRRVRRRRIVLPLLLGFVLWTVGMADVIHASPLLAAMSLGFVTRWRSGNAHERMFAPIEFLEETVFVIFFTIAGLHFDPRVFTSSLDLVVLYVLARTAGKGLGANLGARLSRAPVEVRRWLGLGLVPQAGVAVGLALTLAKEPAFSSISQRLLNIILATTLVYEVAGPLVVRFALGRAGELGEKRRGKLHART